MITSKKLLSVFLTFLVSASLVPVTAATANPFDRTCDLSGDGSSETPYLLGSESDLLDMEQCSVSTGNTLHFELTSNIFIQSDFVNGERQYLNEAVDDNEDPLSVTLDGNNFGIYGLSLSEYRNDVGIFSQVSALTVKDITVQAGVIKGAGPTGVFAGKATRVDFDNVFVSVEGFMCTAACGVLVGEVTTGSNSVDDVTVVAESFLAGGNAGLLFGTVNGNLAIENVTASAKYGSVKSMYSFGGLVGYVYDSDTTTISNVYVSLEDGLEQSSGAKELGGLVGTIYTTEGGTTGEIEIDNVYVELESDQGNEKFGGLIAEVWNDLTQELPITVSDVRISGRVFYKTGSDGGAGLFSSFRGGSSSAVTVTDAYIDVTHEEGGVTIDPVLPANETGVLGASLTNVYISGDPNGTGITTNSTDSNQGTVTTITDSTTFAFANIASGESGTLGTDDWETCSATDLFPSFTPNACDTPDVTLSSSTSSTVIGQAAVAITESEPKGDGESIFYAIEPSLPRGMFLNPKTGTISGTPQEVSSSRIYKISKHNAFTQNRSTKGSATLTLETKLPPTPDTPDPEVIRDTVVIEREVPADYTGPLLTDVSAQLVNRCQDTEISLLGQDLDKLKKLYLGTSELSFEINNSRLVFTLPCLDSAEYSLKLESDGGTLEYKRLFNLVDVATGENSVVQDFTADQVVNAGSFKGYVAVYAKGYEGKKLSAKIGNDWVIVDSLASDFERITDFTGAGYDISVRIFIDGVLTRTVDITTK